MRPLLFLCLTALCASCGVSREFRCEQTSQCVRDGVAGSCLPPGFCAFDDGDCASGMRWDSTAGEGLGGACVDESPVAGPDASTATNACGGTSDLPFAPGTACGVCDSGSYQCVGPNLVTCQGESDLDVPITSDGAVSASTEFSDSFRAELSVDGDLTTSWFSSGPEAGGAPTVYRWTGPTDECISAIKLRGNGGHDNASFQTGYGFEQVTVQVLDAGDDVVFSETHSLTGTPDPMLDLTPNVVGRKVNLLLLGHEADDCGGFSELVVNALR